MKRLPFLSFAFAIFALALTILPAGAQTEPAELNLNAYQCPADYDQISDCVKLSGVAVDVKQNQAQLVQLVTSAESGVTAELTVGAFIDLEIVEIPEGTELQADAALSFTAVAGQNPVTLIFIEQGEETPVAESSDLIVRALVCPVEYEGETGADYEANCEPELDIAVTVTGDTAGTPIEGATGDDGSVTFIDLAEDDYTIELGVPGDFATFRTACTPNGVDPRTITENPNTNLISIRLAPAETLTCTFYVIPVNAQGEPTVAPTVAATVAPTQPAGQVGSLPDTGSGSAATTGGVTIHPGAFLSLVVVVGMVILAASRRTTTR